MTTSEQWQQFRAIEEIKARYCRFLDTKQWEAWADLFTEDAEMDVSDDVPPEVGEAIIKGRGPIARQVRAVVESARTSHQVHSPEISFDSPDTARAIWAMQDTVVWQDGPRPIESVKWLQGFGHYHETYVRREGRWWIASLKLTRLYVNTA